MYMIHHQGGKYVSFRNGSMSNMLRRHDVEQLLDQRVRVESSEALMRVRRELHEMLGGPRRSSEAHWYTAADEPQLSSCTHIPAAAYGVAVFPDGRGETEAATVSWRIRSSLGDVPAPFLAEPWPCRLP